MMVFINLIVLGSSQMWCIKESGKPICNFPGLKYTLMQNYDIKRMGKLTV